MDSSDSTPNDSHSSSSPPPPLIPMESITSLESITIANFAPLPPYHHITSVYPSDTSLAGNMKFVLESMCQSYHHGIKVFEEMLRTIRAQIGFVDNQDSEDHHQVDYYESMLGAIEQNIASWHNQYESILYQAHLPIYYPPSNGLSNQISQPFSLVLENGETIPIIHPVNNTPTTVAFPIEQMPVVDQSQVILQEQSPISQMLPEQSSTEPSSNESPPIIPNPYDESLNSHMINQPVLNNTNGEYFVYETNPGSQLVNPNDLNDISNTYEMQPTPSNFLDVETELSQLFDDNPPSPSFAENTEVDPLVEMIIQNETNASAPYEPAMYDDVNTAPTLMQPTANVHMMPQVDQSTQQQMYYSQQIQPDPMMAQPIMYSSTECPSILGEALTAAPLDPTIHHQTKSEIINQSHALQFLISE